MTEKRLGKLEDKTDKIEITLAKLSGLPEQINRLEQQNDKIFNLLESQGQTLTNARLEIKEKRSIGDCEDKHRQDKHASNGGSQSTNKLYLEVIKVLVAALIAMGGAVGGIRLLGG